MTTRSQKKNKTPQAPVILNKRNVNAWLLLCKDSLLQNDAFNIISLPHPSTGNTAKYCLDDTNEKIFEVVTFSEPHRSWFIGETVKSDGSIQMLTPVNPIFLVLPKLIEQCSSRAVPLEDLLSEKGFSKVLNFVKNLDVVADLKGSPDMKAYKYNEDKTLKWLQEKVEKTAKVLRDKNIHVTSGAVSATFVTSNTGDDDVDEEFYLKYAYGLISEYLQHDLSEKLKDKFNFKPDLVEAIGKKRKSEATDSLSNKRSKSDIIQNNDSFEDKIDIKPVEVKKQKPLSAKDKARQKAASGTKTISSFFTKK